MHDSQAGWALKVERRGCERKPDVDTEREPFNRRRLQSLGKLKNSWSARRIRWNCDRRWKPRWSGRDERDPLRIQFNSGDTIRHDPHERRNFRELCRLRGEFATERERSARGMPITNGKRQYIGWIASYGIYLCEMECMLARRSSISSGALRPQTQQSITAIREYLASRRRTWLVFSRQDRGSAKTIVSYILHQHFLLLTHKVYYIILPFSAYTFRPFI